MKCEKCEKEFLLSDANECELCESIICPSCSACKCKKVKKVLRENIDIICSYCKNTSKEIWYCEIKKKFYCRDCIKKLSACSGECIHRKVKGASI